MWEPSVGAMALGFLPGDYYGRTGLQKSFRAWKFASFNFKMAQVVFFQLQCVSSYNRFHTSRFGIQNTNGFTLSRSIEALPSLPRLVGTSMLHLHHLYSPVICIHIHIIHIIHIYIAWIHLTTETKSWPRELSQWLQRKCTALCLSTIEATNILAPSPWHM